MRLLLGLLLLSTGFAQPPLIVGNAAAPTWGVAPGSMVAFPNAGNPFLPGPDLATVQVEIRPVGSAKVFAAQPVASTASSILAVLPADLPVGLATVNLTIGADSPRTAMIQVVPSAFGIFTSGGGGLGPALAQNQDAGKPPELNQLTNPATPGQYITLWGTGLGASPAADVTIEIAGISVKPTYAGPAPGLPGMDQINFPLPGATPDGCYIPVTVRAGNVVSGEVTIAKAGTRGQCAHPLGLTAAEEATLDQGGSIPFETISIDSSVLPSIGEATTYTRGESLFVTSTAHSAAMMFILAQPHEPDSRYFACRLASPGGVYGFLMTAQLDAGPSVTITGPASQQAQATAAIPGVYQYIVANAPVAAPPEQLPAPYFTAGTWQVSAPGGADIRPFLRTVALPPPIQWTNREALKVIGRNADVAVTWSPEGYSETDVMTVTLSSGGFQIPMPAGAASLGMVCRAPARDGRLVLPAALLGQVAPTPGSASFVNGGSLRLQVAPRPGARPLFTLPLAAGGSLPGISYYTLAETARVRVEAPFVTPRGPTFSTT